MTVIKLARRNPARLFWRQRRSVNIPNSKAKGTVIMRTASTVSKGRKSGGKNRGGYFWNPQRGWCISGVGTLLTDPITGAKLKDKRTPEGTLREAHFLYRQTLAAAVKDQPAEPTENAVPLSTIIEAFLEAAKRENAAS